MPRSLAAIALFAFLLVACGIPAVSPAPTVSPPPTIATASTSPSAGATLPLATEAVASPPVPRSDATVFPDPGGYAWTPVTSGLQSPVDIQFAAGDPSRMFVIEQAGKIRIVENGQLLEMPFLDITDQVESGGNEQGLLGLAFHAHYTDNRYFFVNYTDKHKHDVISGLRVSSDANQADKNSETTLLSIDDPFPNHNGGVLAFGPDGDLYAGLGDGGSAGDPFGNGQNTETLLGKILRINVDAGKSYAIPADNPFAQGGGSPEVWAYGLRNPWRISFDRATGDLYIADVGQDLWEEVDFLPAGSRGGANFGWNYFEGNHPFSGAPPPSLTFTGPVFEYSHQEGGCSITGGYVYRGRMPEWRGIYLFGDYCSGMIWGLMHTVDTGGQYRWQSKVLFTTPFSITTFGQDPDGEIYLADRGGSIYRLEQR